MKNTIKLYEDKRRSKLYVRYRINGTSRDETLDLEWHSNVWMDKQIKINKRSKKLAEEYVFKKRMDLFKSENALDFIENQNKSFISFYKKIANERGVNSKVTLDGYYSALNKLIDYLKTLGVSDLTFKQVNESFCSSNRE